MIFPFFTPLCCPVSAAPRRRCHSFIDHTIYQRRRQSSLMTVSSFPLLTCKILDAKMMLLSEKKVISEKHIHSIIEKE